MSFYVVIIAELVMIIPDDNETNTRTITKNNPLLIACTVMKPLLPM